MRSLNDSIALCERLGNPGQAELFRAVRDRKIDLVVMVRETPFNDKVMVRATKPIVILLGDDDGAATGPAGFRAWRRLRSWASIAVVHAAAADVQTYQTAIALAVLQQRLLLIETTTAEAGAWVDALADAGIPAVGIVARGGVHPVSAARRQGAVS